MVKTVFHHTSTSIYSRLYDELKGKYHIGLLQVLNTLTGLLAAYIYIHLRKVKLVVPMTYVLSTYCMPIHH